MWNTKSNRIMEIAIIVIVGAIVSVLNTLVLRSSLIKQVERIAKDNELNILSKSSKVTDIASKQGQEVTTKGRKRMKKEWKQDKRMN